MHSLGAEHGGEVSDEDAEKLARSVPDWPAFDDSHNALRLLGTKYKLIILSNVDRDSFAGSNRRLGVEFTSIVTAQDVGSYKPSRRNFDALLAEARRLGVGEGKLRHVAQSLFHDHVPAKQAGLPTVWINRRHDRPGWGATPATSAPVTRTGVPVHGRLRRATGTDREAGDVRIQFHAGPPIPQHAISLRRVRTTLDGLRPDASAGHRRLCAADQRADE
jgi:hypothetical protein